MLRSTTNLKVPEHLQLPRKELKSGFLYVYGKGYTGPEPVFMNSLWLSTFFPEIVKDPSFGKNRKGIRAWATFAEKTHPAGYLKLRKMNNPDDPHFVAAVPLATFNRHAVQETSARFRSWFTDAKVHQSTDSAGALDQELKSNSESKDVQQKIVLGKEAIHNMGVDGKAFAELESTLIALRLVYKGSLAVVFADFKISKEIAQQLTTTEWLMIRNIDLYPLLLNWVAGLFGYKTDAPLAAFPVSKIAKTLPPVLEGQARINEHGLSIDPKGNPMWLPAKLDNTTRYEDLYSQVGDKGDDTFGLLEVGHAADVIAMGGELKAQLPSNVPVLIDWVNNKYAYTLSSGTLKVQDLSRFKAADAAHVNNLLCNWSMDKKRLSNIVNIAVASGVKDQVFLTEEEIGLINQVDPMTAAKLSHGTLNVEEYWEIAESYFSTQYDIKIALKEVSIEGDPIMRPLGRFMNDAHAAISSNIDAVNVRFAVATVSSILGMVTLLSKYANEYTKVELEANKICAAAKNQRVDKDWTPPTIPLLSDKIGFLPHQRKVRNLLKDSPDFAILPVQAGGGKSVLAITDVLYEIKANRNQPYLILCPSHLVAQYVKEIVFFTSGKLNVVPINTYTIFRNGFERLTKLLEHAPRNTVVVADYDALRGRQEQVCYGTSAVTVYPVIEFLRQFNFGYVMMDESHYVKNDSMRTRATMVLIADIPKKRLASGTMAHDSPSDLAIQIAMLDPTLFGSREEFNARFGAKVRGNRVIEWNPGAQQDIMRMIKSRVVVAKAMRKEWAALLPTAIELFHRIDLSPNQQQVYSAILTEALDKLKADAKNNKTLQKFFKEQGPKKLEGPDSKGGEDEELAEDEDQEDAADENAGEDLEALLGFYLARLEQFVTAPGKDELGARLLSGDDLRSPKVNKIIEIVREHIDKKIEGKVLIFTNYTDSAEEIFDSFPDDLKKQGILYKAADKVETGNIFENAENIKWMVGVENSMNTGLNLQFVSRLIRVETVWNPGTLEQGNSRVNRPELKKADRREHIYYDWVVANRTIDVTKISRLISKTIAVAKFENADSIAYEGLEDVPVIPMNSDAIEAMNDWDANLKPYAMAYKGYKQVLHDDYKEYRERHGEVLLQPVQVADDPKDAALLGEVPYTPGLEVYKGPDLGLIRVDEFLRQDASTTGPGDDEEAEDGAGALTMKQKKIQEAADAIIGKPIHTEFGDGIIKSVMVKSKKIDVILPNGFMVRVAPSASFIITKPQKGTPTRELLLKAVSTTMAVTEPTGIAGPTFRQTTKKAERLRQEQEQQEQKRKKSEKAVSVELHFNVSNGFLGITYFVDESNPDGKNALQAMGFRPVPQYAMAEVKTQRHLIKQFDEWRKAGFTLDKSSIEMNISQAFRDLANALLKGKLNHLVNFKFATKNQLVNFFRQELKPSTSKTEIKPYPLIEDGRAFIVMHMRGQPANQRAMKVKAPGVRWQLGADAMVFYGLDLKAVGKKIIEIKNAGIEIANIADLKVEFNKLKKAKIRNDQPGMM